MQTHDDVSCDKGYYEGYDESYSEGRDESYAAGYNEGYAASFSEGSTQVEVKVSVDDGETWTRRRINMGGELDASGLEAGEIVQLQGEKYRVLVGDNGLRIEPIRKPSGGKKRARRR
ncbi:hypothetical protein [Desulfosporosinus sp.]|uniref:hypothetical protein n=1 Tax=Desulfosporosinus sp. TaxID=157907 RepID=UPI0025C348D2|nr:hypothetical protein [Desulfosporosinus sp.]